MPVTTQTFWEDDMGIASVDQVRWKDDDPDAAIRAARRAAEREIASGRIPENWRLGDIKAHVTARPSKKRASPTKKAPSKSCRSLKDVKRILDLEKALKKCRGRKGRR